MSARTTRFGRGRRARRLLGAALLVLALPVLVVGLVWGCGGEAGDPSGEERAGVTGAEGVVERSTGRDSTAEGTTGEAATEPPAPKKPYAAIPPPPGAEPPADPSLSRVLVAGAEDLSDGPLKENRLVTYYGTPLSGYMGVLGESDPDTMMAKLKEQAAAYSAIDPRRPAVPTIELIASIAQRDPGPYGVYLSRAPAEVIEQYAQLAEQNQALLLLDIQIGFSTLASEVNALLPYLERPYVHLAIDTEYAVAPGQVPGVDLGGVSGYDIQKVVEFLDRLVEERNLPDKVVVVHQFASGIVFDKEAIKPTENVQVVLHADGFGSPENKISKYDLLVTGEPIQYGGFKVFYTQDVPVLAPEEVLALDPPPVVISYQ